MSVDRLGLVIVSKPRPCSVSRSSYHEKLTHRGIDRAVDAGNRGLQLERGTHTNCDIRFGAGCGDGLTDSDTLFRSDYATNLNTFTDRRSTEHGDVATG